MKKTLATLLVLAMVASLCCVMFVSADEAVNLALGKTVTGADPKSGSNYTGALTDGNAAEELSYDNNWFAYYWNPDKTPDENYANGANSVDGVGTPVVDLGEICTLDTLRVNTFLGCKDGITPPDYLTVEVSADGEAYTEIDSIDFEEAEAGDTTVEWVEVELGGVAARYVRLKLGHVSTWVFLNEIEVYGTVGAATEEVREPNTISISHVNCYTWGVYNSMVMTEVGKNCTNSSKVAYPCDWWYAFLVEDIDGVYTVTDIEGSGEAKVNVVPEGGFILYVYSNDAASWAAAEKIQVGDVMLDCTVDWSVDAASETSIGTMTFGVAGDESAPETVTETIELDGKLDDTGYTNAVWFADGIWQYAKDTDPIIADLDVQYTVRSDDANIYLTIKVNRGVEFDAPLPEEAYTDTSKFNQVGSTNFRIWLCGDGMESRTFYDLLWDGEKFETFRAKVLTEEITYSAGTGDDYINLEMAIAKESLAITDSFKLMVTYSSPYCGEGETVAYNAFHMTVCDEMPSGWSSSTDAYSEYACADIALGTYTVEDEPVVDDNAREELEAELEELVGAPVETPAYTWNIETAIDEETGKVTVTITVSGVDAFDLQCIEGTFHYDATVLTLLNESDKENALQCITEPKGSEGEWENMSAVVADGEIRLGAVTFGEATLSDADPMIFTLEFTLAEGTTLTGMYIDTAESYGMDVDANIVYGNGGYGVLEIETEESTPESSTPADDSSDDDVDAGDAGILVFAILGILAIAGAAVVIKVRN